MKTNLSDTWLGALIINILAFIFVVSIFVIPASLYSYTQRFIEEPNNLASSGIFFTKTIELEQYKHLGNGSGLFGKYSIYSRSDRHESINVYKK